MGEVMHLCRSNMRKRSSKLADEWMDLETQEGEKDFSKAPRSLSYLALVFIWKLESKMDTYSILKGLEVASSGRTRGAVPRFLRGLDASVAALGADASVADVQNSRRKVAFHDLEFQFMRGTSLAFPLML